MKKSLIFKLFYMMCAGALMICFFIDRSLSYGLILGACISYISTLLFNKQKKIYSKTKKLPAFLATFFVKYIIIGCLLYLVMQYSRTLFQGSAIGFVLNQIILLMERTRAQDHNDRCC